MRKAILALVVMGMLIGVSGVAMATTYVWTSVDSPNGETHFQQRHETQGQYYGDGDGGTWSGSGDANGKTTAYTTEEFHNDQCITYTSYFDTSNGDYDSERWSDLDAEGNTKYYYDYYARSLCFGKAEDITEYVIDMHGYTQTGDQPVTHVEGTAPGYGGDDASDWSQAIHFSNYFITDEPVQWDSFAWTNPQHYK